ncbi:hypothetical protein PCE1_004794 [Barthelona sp. PCE]
MTYTSKSEPFCCCDFEQPQYYVKAERALSNFTENALDSVYDPSQGVHDLQYRHCLELAAAEPPINTCAHPGYGLKKLSLNFINSPDLNVIDTSFIEDCMSKKEERMYTSSFQFSNQDSILKEIKMRHEAKSEYEKLGFTELSQYLLSYQSNCPELPLTMNHT